MKHRLIGAFVVLAMSLVFGTAAAAETLQLTCESTSPANSNDPSTVKVHVDFNHPIVALIDPDGATIISTADRVMNALPASVRISDGAVQWRLANSLGFIFEGLLNRETGDIHTKWLRPREYGADAGFGFQMFSGRCRRATQKF